MWYLLSLLGLTCSHPSFSFPRRSEALGVDVETCLRCGHTRTSKTQFGRKYAGGGRWIGDPVPGLRGLRDAARATKATWMGLRRTA